MSVNRRFTLLRCETKAVNFRKCSNIFYNVRWHFDSVNEQKQAVHLNVSAVTFATQEAFHRSFFFSLPLGLLSSLRCHKLRVPLL